jgi:uncharacterized damage-inducible protein DinB
MIDWSPGPGVRTIGGQLFEIAVVEHEAIAWLMEGRTVSDGEAEAEFGDIRSLENLKATLSSVRQATVKAIESLSDAQLDESIPLKKPWFAMPGLGSAPRAELFRGIALHEWYHVGQLMSYLWARGDNPYDW